MKKLQKRNILKKNRGQKGETRTLLRCEGKFLHGTFGKPTHGPRGNKH